MLLGQFVVPIADGHMYVHCRSLDLDSCTHQNDQRDILQWRMLGESSLWAQCRHKQLKRNSEVQSCWCGKERQRYGMAAIGEARILQDHEAPALLGQIRWEVSMALDALPPLFENLGFASVLDLCC